MSSLQLVEVYCRGMIPGLWPYILSCVIMKVRGAASPQGAQSWSNVASRSSSF